MRVISPSVASAHSTVYTNDLRFPLDSDAATGIFAAARECNLSSLQNLVEQGVEVNKKDGAGQSALVWAVRSHCVAGVKYLLEQGADRYSRSANGLDANGWARKYDNPQILELLGAT